MTDLFIRLAESMHGAFGYLLLGLFACIENLVPPIPGDTVTVFGGYLCGIGRLNLFGVVAATTAGSFAGFMLLYGLGAILGRHYLMHNQVRFFPHTLFVKVTGWFERFGYSVVLGNRFLSGARSVISLCAGMARLRPLKVSLYGFLSCFTWNLLLIVAGNKVGQNWERITSVLRQYNTAVLCALIIGAVVCVILKKGPFGNSA